MNLLTFRLATFLLTGFILFVAIIPSPGSFLTATRSFAERFYARSASTTTNSTSPNTPSHLTSISPHMTTNPRTPAYFLSHGGVNPFLLSSYSRVATDGEISQISCTTPPAPCIPDANGLKVTQKFRPKAVIVSQLTGKASPT